MGGVAAKIGCLWYCGSAASSLSLSLCKNNREGVVLYSLGDENSNTCIYFFLFQLSFVLNDIPFHMASLSCCGAMTYGEDEPERKNLEAMFAGVARLPLLGRGEHNGRRQGKPGALGFCFFIFGSIWSRLVPGLKTSFSPGYVVLVGNPGLKLISNQD